MLQVPEIWSSRGGGVFFGKNKNGGKKKTFGQSWLISSMYGIYTYILVDVYGLHVGFHIPVPWILWVV